MIGGAIPVFQLINDMFELLAVQTDAELESLLRREWIDRWGHVAPKEAIMPSTETLLSVSKASRLRRHALRVDHDNVQRRYVGGHVFPRAPQAKTPPKPAQRTQTRQLQAKFSREQTIAIRAACKAHGVSIGNAFFALCNIAWLRLMAAHPEYRQCAPKELPMLLYSVVNLEHILPPCRALATSEMRAERAKGWARFDDAIAQGSKAPPPASPATGAGAPSLALMGLSQQGSVDALFRTERYPAIELLDLMANLLKRNTAKVDLDSMVDSIIDRLVEGAWMFKIEFVRRESAARDDDAAAAATVRCLRDNSPRCSAFSLHTTNIHCTFVSFYSPEPPAGKNGQPDREEIQYLCKRAREIFMEQPMLLELEAPIKYAVRPAKPNRRNPPILT
ncbi:unnamed protein product [Mycena citricolor]|uniref:Serine-threonine protein phosphatase N-terminal domain-containing protein n=1 Tax=Mycena citricolor TaxID=2018698 RepID=A0AAD2K3E3_9AGAR|nr:unnamed protein product [Mycena citricolor]